MKFLLALSTLLLAQAAVIEKRCPAGQCRDVWEGGCAPCGPPHFNDNSFDTGIPDTRKPGHNDRFENH